MLRESILPWASPWASPRVSPSASPPPSTWGGMIRKKIPKSQKNEGISAMQRYKKPWRGEGSTKHKTSTRGGPRRQQPQRGGAAGRGLGGGPERSGKGSARDPKRSNTTGAASLALSIRQRQREIPNRGGSQDIIPGGVPRIRGGSFAQRRAGAFWGRNGRTILVSRKVTRVYSLHQYSLFFFW